MIKANANIYTEIKFRTLKLKFRQRVKYTDVIHTWQLFYMQVDVYTFSLEIYTVLPGI